MRGFFRHKAQRDSLRPELEQAFNSSSARPGRNRRSLPDISFKNLVSVFVLAALANEASHFHQPHNPHGNRRERIEEIRMRLSEAELNSRGQRALNAGGHPPERPTPNVHSETLGRRRTPGLDAHS